MNKKLLGYSLIVLVIVVAVVVVISYYGQPAPGRLDTFAKCLAGKGFTMYGAAWCPHCQNVKREFGASFQYVPYVECPDNPSLCQAKGITGYPTFLFSDGRRIEGEQTLEQLSQAASCPLTYDQAK